MGVVILSSFIYFMLLFSFFPFFFDLLLVELVLTGLYIGTSILFLMTKHTPNIELNKLKKPIIIDIAISSIIAGITASHRDLFAFRYG